MRIHVDGDFMVLVLFFVFGCLNGFPVVPSCGQHSALEISFVPGLVECAHVSAQVLAKEGDHSRIRSSDRESVQLPSAPPEYITPPFVFLVMCDSM
jgi:hypothetical protein